VAATCCSATSFAATEVPSYIVSDCGAIDDIFLRHKVVQTAPEAASLAVKTGTDLDCGRVYPSLADAVKQGLITEAQIDTSLTRLFLARFKLGMSTHPRWYAGRKRLLGARPARNRELARQVAESPSCCSRMTAAPPLRRTCGRSRHRA
jgi:beta-glucosidase